MKVLHGMTEMAGQGSHSVKGLKYNGVDAKMILRKKNPANYQYDYYINVGKKKWLYPYYAIKLLLFAVYATVKFDCFHFHSGWTLVPGRYDLRWLKLFDKKIFVEFHGTDIRWIFNREKYDYLPMPEVSYHERKAILTMLRYVDGIIIHDEELRKHIPETKVPIYVVPLRVDVEQFIPQYPQRGVKKPIVVHAPSRRSVKGSEYIFKVAKELEDKIDFILVENKTQQEAFEIYKKADIIIDQVLLGTYGVFAIEAMALGKPVITYIKEDILNTFPDTLPVFNASPSTLKLQLEKLIYDEELRIQKGMESRKYVEKYHNCFKNARLLKEIYEGNGLPLRAQEVFKYVGEIEKIEGKDKLGL